MEHQLSVIRAALEKYMGGKAKVEMGDACLRFEVDCGPRTACVGGWAGGTTEGYVRKEELTPRMLAGVNPFRASTWYDLLEPLGWFD